MWSLADSLQDTYWYSVAQRSSASAWTDPKAGGSPSLDEPGALLNRHEDLVRGHGLLDIISCQQAIVIVVELSEQSAGQSKLNMTWGGSYAQQAVSPVQGV